MSRLGRLSLGVAVAAGAVLGATQITSGSNNSTKESVFVGIVPARLLDTREDQTTFDGFDQAVGRLDAGTTYELDIADRAGIPTDALSVTANLVAVNPSGPGYLTVYPCGFDKPLAAALNYMPGVDNANEFSVPIGEYGDICIYTLAETDIVVDIYGYYIAGSGTEGPQGPAGPAGPQGPIGTGITVKGTLPNNAAGPPSFDGTDTGDVWIDVNNEAWVWTDQGAWDDAGNIQGPAGADGADGQDAESPERVIWVADDGTGDYELLSAALASITDASATKPYVIKIAPGTYTETATVVLKDYVDVEGSGQGITTIECACSDTGYNTAAVVSATAINAEIRQLTISNTGGASSRSVGLYTKGVPDGSFKMTHMTATATGGTSENVGVYNAYDGVLFSTAPVMNNVTATAAGGSTSYGVYNFIADTVMNHVTATAGGGNSKNYGVYNSGVGYQVMNHVTATATGGSSAIGVYNSSSNPAMNHVTATATDGTDNYGVYNSSDGRVSIRNSSIEGDTNSIFNIIASDGFGNRDGHASIADTELIGDVTGDHFSCIGSYTPRFEKDVAGRDFLYEYQELNSTCNL